MTIEIVPNGEFNIRDGYKTNVIYYYLQSCAKYRETLPLFSIKCTCLCGRIYTLCKSSMIAKYIILSPSLQATLGSIVRAIFCNTILPLNVAQWERRVLLHEKCHNNLAPDCRFQ